MEVISQVVFMTYDFSHDYNHQSLFFCRTLIHIKTQRRLSRERLQVPCLVSKGLGNPYSGKVEQLQVKSHEAARDELSFTLDVVASIPFVVTK